MSDDEREALRREVKNLTATVRRKRKRIAALAHDIACHVERITKLREAERNE